MAHKHNRRRVRPRVRQSRQNFHSNQMSYDTLSLEPHFSVPQPQFNRSFATWAHQSIPQCMSGVANPYGSPKPSGYFERCASPKGAIDVESERIKMFGGEPGDSEKQDISLCFKMAEVFEEMDWINV